MAKVPDLPKETDWVDVDGVWFHLAVTEVAGDERFYINGWPATKGDVMGLLARSLGVAK